MRTLYLLICLSMLLMACESEEKAPASNGEEETSDEREAEEESTTAERVDASLLEPSRTLGMIRDGGGDDWRPLEFCEWSTFASEVMVGEVLSMRWVEEAPYALTSLGNQVTDDVAICDYIYGLLEIELQVIFSSKGLEGEKVIVRLDRERLPGLRGLSDSQEVIYEDKDLSYPWVGQRIGFVAERVDEVDLYVPYGPLLELIEKDGEDYVLFQDSEIAERYPHYGGEVVVGANGLEIGAMMDLVATCLVSEVPNDLNPRPIQYFTLCTHLIEPASGEPCVKQSDCVEEDEICAYDDSGASCQYVGLECDSDDGCPGDSVCRYPEQLCYGGFYRPCEEDGSCPDPEFTCDTALNQCIWDSTP